MPLVENYNNIVCSISANLWTDLTNGSHIYHVSYKPVYKVIRWDCWKIFPRVRLCPLVEEHWLLHLPCLYGNLTKYGTFLTMCNHVFCPVYSSHTEQRLRPSLHQYGGFFPEAWRAQSVLQCWWPLNACHWTWVVLGPSPGLRWWHSAG